jgi:hypothetical protein
MGLIKRRWYKPERKPRRKRGVLQEQAPVGCPDASHYEIGMALASICKAANMKVGRGGDYDPIKDLYTIVGSIDGKAQDLKVEGVAVAALINQLRVWNGVEKFDKQGLTKALG